jgi:hypothetical protein
MRLLALAQSRTAFSVFNELNALLNFLPHPQYLAILHLRYRLGSAGEAWESLLLWPEVYDIRCGGAQAVD